MLEDMIYAAGETGTGSDSDIAEIPVPRNLEGAGAVPTPTTTPTSDQANTSGRKETIVLSSDSDAMSVEVVFSTGGPINSVGSTIEFATASSTPRSTTCSMGSAPNSNSSILDQDTEEVRPESYQEVDVPMGTNNNYFYVSDSSVESNPVDEEVFQRARSEEIVEEIVEDAGEATENENVEDIHQCNQYYPPIQLLEEPSVINHRQVLVNLINNAKARAESDWGWRDDVGDVDRDDALANLTLLYDSLLDKYDYLEAAYDVLAEIYNQSQILADAQEDLDGAQVDVQADVPPQEAAPDTYAQSAQETEAGPSRLRVPNGYARSECGSLVKTEEIALPQKIPSHATQYKIPRPSNSFADVTCITNVTRLSVISKSPIDSATDISVASVADIFAEDGEEADDPDYNPTNMDSREADTEDGGTSDDASKSSLRAYHAGVTSASLYSHPPETTHEAKVRVSSWLDTAKARNTRLHVALGEAIQGEDGSYTRPESTHSPVTTAHMVSVVGSDLSLRPAGPIRQPSPVTRRSKLRPTSKSRPLSYLLAGTSCPANRTFREYFPEVAEVPATDSDNV
jgi:hypothetical protein